MAVTDLDPDTHHVAAHVRHEHARHMEEQMGIDEPGDRREGDRHRHRPGWVVRRFCGHVAGPNISSAGSVSRDLAPGHVAVDADIAGQAEHPLAEDVLHDLGGAALDRVGPRAEELLLE